MVRMEWLVTSSSLSIHKAIVCIPGILASVLYRTCIHLAFSYYTGCNFHFCVQIIESKPISKQCDVYSYGIVVWELLTHKIPFEDVTDLLQIYQRVALNKEVGD